MYHSLSSIKSVTCVNKEKGTEVQSSCVMNEGETDPPWTRVLRLEATDLSLGS